MCILTYLFDNLSQLATVQNPLGFNFMLTVKNMTSVSAQESEMHNMQQTNSLTYLRQNSPKDPPTPASDSLCAQRDVKLKHVLF